MAFKFKVLHKRRVSTRQKYKSYAEGGGCEA